MKNFNDQIKKLKDSNKLSDGSVIDEKIIWLLFLSLDSNNNKTEYNEFYQRDKLREDFPDILSTRNQKRILIPNVGEFRTLLVNIG